MDDLREYLIGVTAAALICGVAAKLHGQGLVGSVIKLVSGIFMALAVVSPWVNIRLDALTDFTSGIQISADQAAADGENSARDAMKEIISQQTRTYILDKAESLEVELTVEVVLTDDDLPVPCGVTLRGNISPYAKSVLRDYISDNLGIDSEDQTWIS